VGDGHPERYLPALTRTQPTQEQALRAVRIIWFGFIVSIGVFYYLTKTVFEAVPDQNSRLVWPMLGIAIYAVLVASLRYKRSFGRRASKPRTLAVLKARYIFGLMRIESATTYGLVAYLILGWPRYWIFFLISGAGFLLNIPRREDFEQPQM
jgi:hypothetical protein